MVAIVLRRWIAGTAAALMLAATLVVAPTAMSDAQAHARLAFAPWWPGKVTMLTWLSKGAEPKVVPRKDGYGCTVTFNSITVREFGKSGITQFAVKWELRGYYDTGKAFLPTYASTGWGYSKWYADTESNSWLRTSLPAGYINMIPTNGATYNLWVRIVGVRAGMLDVRRHVNLGAVSCGSHNANMNQNLGPGAGGGRPYS